MRKFMGYRVRVKRTAGFTLLEVLVAIALAGLLLTSIYGVFSTTGNAKEQVEAKAAALHLARILFARLDRELLGLAAENRGTIPALIGGRNSLGEAYIELLTNSGSGRQPGIHQISYRLGPDREGLMTLWRAEKGIFARDPLAEGNLTQRIESLSFSFFDGVDWREEWNSLTGGQPMLVRVELKLQGAEQEAPLVGTFDLPKR